MGGRRRDVPKQFMVPILFILTARTVPHSPRQRASATSAFSRETIAATRRARKQRYSGRQKEAGGR